MTIQIFLCPYFHFQSLLFFRFYAEKFGKNKKRRNTVAAKLRASGIDYPDTEMEELGGGPAQGVTEQRLMQLEEKNRSFEATVLALNQELSRLRGNPGSRSTGLYEARDRSSSISLDVSASAFAGKEPKHFSPSSPLPQAQSLLRLDDGVGVRGANVRSSDISLVDLTPELADDKSKHFMPSSPSQLLQRLDDGLDEALVGNLDMPASQSLKKVQRSSNVLKAALFFETGQEEPDASIVHRSILAELYKIPQIKSMSNNDVEAAVRASVRMEGNPQQILMRKGDTDNFMIFTVVGNLYAKISDDSPPSEIGCGSLVGSHAFLYKRPRSATVSCIGHCVYYRFELNQSSFMNAAMTQFYSYQPDSYLLALDTSKSEDSGGILKSAQFSADSRAPLQHSAAKDVKLVSDAMKVAGRGSKPTVSSDRETLLNSSLSDDPSTSLGQC
jgi:hypothetical protein